MTWEVTYNEAGWSKLMDKNTLTLLFFIYIQGFELNLSDEHALFG